MRKVELLAPAGNKESLIAAIQNGADAVYLGGNHYNARSSAKNFNDEDMKWAVSYAHLRQVKVYVTLNILYQDHEFKKLISYVDFLYHLQVDALIIQDIGLYYIVHQLYPDFELHVSTQASVMNSFGVKYFESIGAKRVVLARENTIEEVKEICQNTSIEIEVFIHGAICICYSGQCLMSSMIGKRSGNRGECAQPCRLSYRLVEDNHILPHKIPYLLSPKDLMIINDIPELIKSGVHSFKIEGRMKSPEYVANVVKAYRNAIDQYYNNKVNDVNNNIDTMKKVFNRDYTNGYLFHDDRIVKGDYSGNKGIIIGTVLSYDKKKKRVLIKLNKSLYQEDHIMFENIDKGRPVNKMYKNNKLISQGHKGDKIEIEFDTPVHNGFVRKTKDKNLFNDIRKTYQNENIKLPIQMTFSAKINQPATLTVYYQNISITKTSDYIGEIGNRITLDKNSIKKQLNKLGNTVFVLEHINIRIDDHLFLPLGVINELRRKTIDELTLHLSNQKIHTEKKETNFQLSNKPSYQHQFHVMVENLEQLKATIQYPISYIYYPYNKDALEAFQICTDLNIRFALYIPKVMKDKDILEIKKSEIYKKTETIVVNDYGSYYAFSDKNIIVGTGLNIYNSYSSHQYNDHSFILSNELSSEQMKELNINHQNAIYQVYGKIENMISEYCPISQYYFGKQKKHCQLCSKHQYSLLDRKNMKFDILTDQNCRIKLLNSRILLINQIENVNSEGLLVKFTNESVKSVQSILNQFTECYFHNKKIQISQKNKYTYGYFK